MDSKPGDRVKVTTDKETIEGILLPRPEILDQDVTVLKLDTGYNIGISNDRIKSVERVGDGAKLEAFPSAQITQRRDLPSISMIATGGTISSRLDYQTGGVKWLMEPGQIFALVPEVANIARFKEIHTPFLKSSDDMTPNDWQILARLAAELLNDKNVEGIILTHGTDTLHFTAAALTFMLKNLNKPVVLTYSQRSTDRASTDTYLNMLAAARMATSDIAEVMLVGHGSSEDSYCLVNRGVKTRKMHTSRRDTFRPINEQPLASIDQKGNITEMNKNVKKRNESDGEKTVADVNFDDRVALIKYYPGAKPDIIDYYVEKGYRGLIIEATGLGHVAGPDSSNSWMKSLKAAIDKGVVVCCAAQTLYGTLNPLVYSNGRELVNIGVVHLKDMLPETAYVKLGWLLGHHDDPATVRSKMLENMHGEINEKIDFGSYLL